MAKSGNTQRKTPQVKSARRREELRRALPRAAFDWRATIYKPEFTRGAAIILALTAVMSMFVIWSREQIKVRDGQIMLETQLKRITYQLEDAEATAERREEARKNAPKVYQLNSLYLERLAGELNGLPLAVEGKTSTQELSAETLRQFGIDDPGIAALQRFAVDGKLTSNWQSWVDKLVNVEFRRNPLIQSDVYQNQWVRRQSSDKLKQFLELPDGSRQEISGTAIELLEDAPGKLEQRLQDLVLKAGFPPDVEPYVTTHIAWEPRPTFLPDTEATEAEAEFASQTVQPVLVENKAGEVLHRRGDRLSTDQYRAVRQEALQYKAFAPWGARWLPRIGIIGLIAITIGFSAIYIGMAYPRIARNTLRMVGIGVLMVASLALTVAVSIQAPTFLYPAAVAPALLVAVVLQLAYDQRLATFVSAIYCVLVTLALEQGIGWMVLLIIICGMMILQLRELRHRNSLIRAATITAAVAGVGGVLLGAIITPRVEGANEQILMNALLLSITCFGVGFLVLGILPSIERVFDITTGMTLAELRDPKQPLLRQLQQLAPGTYNHSLQVANLAEAAADAIGGNSLQVYVGALYHDVGKINKPGYFVENQSGGYNKHEKLSPAMSLLVIVGHVKDGVALGREYGLPREIIHFIESHHGTTLVEFFYHAARTRAEGDNRAVEEVEYRYPGPKPQTREAGILMLADAVESATRAMAEPNPGRIETLVREMAHKRLLDGQFDQCDLTFRELALIQESMIARLCAIHHSRIAYPSTKSEEAADSGITRRPVSA